MEHLMDAYLNEPRDTWTPWEADEDMFHGIMTGQLVPPAEEAPMLSDAEPLQWFSVAA